MLFFLMYTLKKSNSSSLTWTRNNKTFWYEYCKICKRRRVVAYSERRPRYRLIIVTFVNDVRKASGGEFFRILLGLNRHKH